MKPKILCSFFVIGMVLAVFYAPVHALEKTTHFDINGVAVDKSANVVDAVKAIGFSGVGDTIKSERIKFLIQQGGETEDEPFYTRSVNHYLDPIYNNIGFKGQFKNALEWAKNQSGVLLSTNCSWGATRGYYRQGLTSSTKTERETKLALTFECVGRLMHLVQDMSVPAHTRDDGHVA